MTDLQRIMILAYIFEILSGAERGLDFTDEERLDLIERTEKAVNEFAEDDEEFAEKMNEMARGIYEDLITYSNGEEDAE